MKTIAKFLLAIPLLATLAVSCKEEAQEVKESVKIEGLQDAVQIAAVPENDITFTIETNVDWSIAKTNLDWLTISPMRGTAKDGIQTIALVADNNNLEETRTGNFTLTAGATTKTVTVTQAALVVIPEFKVNGLEAQTLSFSGEDNAAKTFQVMSNKNWTAAKANLDWATVSPVEGEKNRSATITVTPTEVNNTGAERTGTISFSYGAEAPCVVTVKQAAFVPSLEVSPESLEFAKGGEAKTVTITSNTDWTAVSSETWATLSAASGKGNATLTVTVAANEAAARTAKVTITAGTIVKTVSLRQETGVVFTGGINLETNPVIWCADSQEWNMTNNPEFPGPASAATGYVASAEKHGTGVVKPMTETDSGALLTFVDAAGDNVDYSGISKGKFVFPAADPDIPTKGGDIGFRQPWTGDYWLFTVPAKSIASGKTICFDFTFIGTTACPKWWASEIKVGNDWVMMEALSYNVSPAAETVTVSDGDGNKGAATNITLLSPARTPTHYDCSYKVTSTIPDGFLYIRLRVVDATRRIDGKAATSTTSSNTVRLINWDIEGRRIKEGHGPTIYVK